MKNFLSSIFLLLFIPAALFAQTVNPTATPTPKEDVVKISTNLIQVDATVTDKNGKPITDLKPEDFQVFENGEKQTITNFSFVRAGSSTTAPIAASTPKNNTPNKEINQLPIPSVPLKPEQVRRTVALVVDDISLSVESIVIVKKALRKFVDEQMQPNDLVAIIQLGKGIGALQQFTSNKRQLYAAIENVKWNPLGRGQATPIEPLQPKVGKMMQLPAAESGDAAVGLRDPDAIAAQERDSVLATLSLDAINYVVRGMKVLPGRKSIMLLSDGLKVINRDIVGKEGDLRVMAYMQKLVDSANRSSVVINTVDVRGLEPLQITAADNTTGYSTQDIQTALETRRDDFSDNQEGLSMIAKETGGRAFLNQNDINQSVDKALNDQKDYYLIGYQPDTETFDAKTRRFNKLEIKVNRPDANVRYRSGFFNIEEVDNQSVKLTAQQQLVNALTSPFTANQLNIKFNALYGNGAETGPYVRSLLHIDAKDLKFTDEPNGDKKATFDILAASYGTTGLIADQVRKNYTITAKAKTFEEVLRDGFVYNFVFPIKKPGSYQIRVAVRDSANGNVGAANQFIEIPNLKKESLAISGIILENFTTAQWQQAAQPSQISSLGEKTDPITDTSLRQFKHGTILRYGVEIYNVKSDEGQKLPLTSQIKLFNNGKLILDGKPIPVDLSKQADSKTANLTGAIKLNDDIIPGDYVLQILISDNSAKGKPKTASQFVEFEIVE